MTIETYKLRLNIQPNRGGQRAGLGGFGPKGLTHPNPRLSLISPFPPSFSIGLDGLGWDGSRVITSGLIGLLC